MYKAAFPWSSLEEEEFEKKYIKSLPETDSEEIAGNVWIPPESALDLAEHYSMRPWIEALLDPEPIAKGTHDPNKRIATPPRFLLPTSEATTLPPPTEAVTSRRRTLRSSSPAKAPPTPSRKIATPRRTRRAKPAASGTLAPTAESAEESSVAPEASVEPESVKFDSIIAEAAAKADVEAEADEEVAEIASPADTVKVDIETTTMPAVNGGEPSVTTHVTVETPANHPDLAQPHDAQEYLDHAKAAIAEAHKMTAGRAAGKKRKALEAFVDEEEPFPALDVQGSTAAVAPVELAERPAKRQRVAEIELRKEKIKKRATVGIAASLAMG